MLCHEDIKLKISGCEVVEVQISDVTVFRNWLAASSLLFCLYYLSRQAALWIIQGYFEIKNAVK